MTKPAVNRLWESAGSLRLTIVLLCLSLVMIFVATLDQVNLGVWGVQQKYFHSFLVWGRVRGTPLTLPIFPGGYLLGGALLLNLVAAHFVRFRFSARKSGIWLTHVGLILLLAGEALSGLLQRDSQLRLNVGQTGRFAESFREFELAVTDTSGRVADKVVVFPADLLQKPGPLPAAGLPFAILPTAYFPNASVLSRSSAAPGEAPRPAAYLQLSGERGPIGGYLVSAELHAPQTFDYGGRHWTLELRNRRFYEPFTVSLVRFTHDVYPGSDIPRNFASRVRVRSDDGKDDRVVDISMNRPLRYRGLAFYQAGYANEDHTSVLQVVSNPAWRLPYLSCGLIGLGLTLQFGLGLARFASS